MQTLDDLLAARCGAGAGPAADAPFLVAWDERPGCTTRLTFREFGVRAHEAASALSTRQHLCGLRCRTRSCMGHERVSDGRLHLSWRMKVSVFPASTINMI